LVGSWDNWTKQIEMTKDGNMFRTSLRLKAPMAGSEYEYKFLVDGVWCYDIEKPMRADQNGNMNNFLDMLNLVEERTALPDTEKPIAKEPTRYPVSSKGQETTKPQDTSGRVKVTPSRVPQDSSKAQDFTGKHQDASRVRDTKDPQQVNKKR